jgi:hypothetical protein
LRLRSRIRDYYGRNYPLTDGAAADPLLNPGNGRVSRLCHEPRAAHCRVVGVARGPHRLRPAAGPARAHTPAYAATDGDTVEAVALRNDRTGDEITPTAKVFIDATELGDLLELADVEHVTGSESAADTVGPPGPQGFLAARTPARRRKVTASNSKTFSAPSRGDEYPAEGRADHPRAA